MTIAGSDSGGGAGVQADLKTFAALGVHGLSVFAALTAQNTLGVISIEVPSIPFVRAQLEACFADFEISAVKIGMLANRQIIETVAEALQAHPNVPVVLDPVMIATSGARLLEADAVHALNRLLLPRATVITPNVPELETLTETSIRNAEDIARAAQLLLDMGVSAVMAKGAHLDEGDQVIDRLFTQFDHFEFVHPRLPVEGHGTGCTFASAIAAQLAKGMTLPKACADASEYVSEAMKQGYSIGHGGLQLLRHIH
ncbi:bifunctional hydroxymethylpyrimidine kinase/phosphomethylpyrimidine kinase [Lysobacter sp. HDW10]|uniref:bifunctional hydroxymethylpyrimidine kinase/phosphomethylpyrimidine kinase n=1 Tax=Lysobacter sp. HDW10 TaxID=2714936 RepID=UPI001F0D397F|nr:bifunctional hydroxymethylpyrimidine kinase/phosphomethylpyrimidine kinase [Lysobacter sp. HDW10]